jgi:hypothetical protein
MAVNASPPVGIRVMRRWGSDLPDGSRRVGRSRESCRNCSSVMARSIIRSASTWNASTNLNVNPGASRAWPM